MRRNMRARSSSRASASCAGIAPRRVPRWPRTGLDPSPYWTNYGENVWAAVKGYLDAVTDAATAPVVTKYTGVLAAADIEEFTSTFMILQSMRLDLGAGSQVHP
jgi:hypothetical protein